MVRMCRCKKHGIVKHNMQLVCELCNSDRASQPEIERGLTFKEWHENNLHIYPNTPNDIKSCTYAKRAFEAALKKGRITNGLADATAVDSITITTKKRCYLCDNKDGYDFDEPCKSCLGTKNHPGFRILSCLTER